MPIPALFSRDYRPCFQGTRTELENSLHTVRPVVSTDQSQTQRTDWELTDSMAGRSSMLSALMSCLRGGKWDTKVLCHIEVTQTCHSCLLWWPLTLGMCCREAQLVWGLHFLPLIIISLWHVTATGITLRKQKSHKTAPTKEQGWMQKESQGCHTRRTCLQPTVACRQVAPKMKSKGRAGRWGRDARRQWHWPSQPIIAELLKKSFSTHSGLLQMGQPAGPKTVSSVTCLDLFSDVVTIHADAIFSSMYTDPSIFSVISIPGLRSPAPGSLRKDKVEVFLFH